MNRDRVKFIIGVSVILAHIGAIIGILIVKQAYISPSQRYDLALVLLPVLATYVLAIVKSAVNNATASSTTSVVNLNYVTVVFLITFSFLFSLLYVVFSFPSGVTATVDDVRSYLGAIEIGLGASFGYIASDLFK